MRQRDAEATSRPLAGRPRVVSRRHLLGVGGLALAGGALSGRVADGDPRASGGAVLTSLARRSRLRIAITDQQAAKIGPLLPRFEEEHDTRVEVTALPASELYSLLAVELLHETQSMDVACLSDDWITSLGRSVVLLSGSDLVSEETATRLHERVTEIGRSLDDDRLVAAPWTLDIGFTAVNGDAVAMSGTPGRWGEFADVVEQAGSSLALAGASGDVAATTFRAVLNGYGTDIVEVATNRPTVTDYDARRAVSVMQRLQASTKVSPLAVDDRVMRDLLSRGSATSCAHVWASTWLDAGSPSGWTLLPPLRGSVPRGSHLLRSWLLAIPKTAADVELSRTFVEWMLSPTTQRSLLDVGLVPSSTDVLGDRDVSASRPVVVDIVRGLARSVVLRPRLRSFPEINRVCGEAVASILAGNASAGVAFQAANTEMRRVLEREGELRL